MKTITRQQFEDMAQGSEVLSEDRHGLKVLILSSGEYVKLFRRKRLISSAVLRPYACRFADAAGKLELRGIPTVTVTDRFKVRGPARDVVCYRPLDGRTLRETYLDQNDIHETMDRFAEFLARLHASGVYFRAIHAANVIVRLDGSMGLIDVSETRFRRRPLNVALRARNFKHLTRYEEDTEQLVKFGVSCFFRHYLANAELSRVNGARLARRLAILGKPFDALG